MKSKLAKRSTITAVITAVVADQVSSWLKAVESKISYGKAFILVLHDIWHGIKWFLSFGVPVWVLILVFGALILTMVIIANRSRNTEPIVPLESYTSDLIEDVVWFWKLRKKYDDGLELDTDSLISRCPKCRRQLEFDCYHPESRQGFLVCTCGFRKMFWFTTQRELVNHIGYEIDRRAYSGEWNKFKERIATVYGN